MEYRKRSKSYPLDESTNDNNVIVEMNHYDILFDIPSKKPSLFKRIVQWFYINLKLNNNKVKGYHIV